MAYYRYASAVIKSDVSFADPCSEAVEATHRFLIEDSGLIQVSSWLYRSEMKERPFLSIGKVSSGFVFRFSEWVDFHFNPNTKMITAFKSSELPDETLQHLLFSQVLPFVLSVSEQVVLHASAVVCASKVIGFLGPSGSGKSTLATAFAQRGFDHFSDDCLVLRNPIDKYVVFGDRAEARLWEDSIEILSSKGGKASSYAHYTRKQKFQLSSCCPDSSVSESLGCLYELNPVDYINQVDIERIEGHEAYMALMSSTFRVDPHCRVNAAREFAELSSVLDSIPVYRISYPHRYEHLDVLIAKVLEHQSAFLQSQEVYESAR